MLSQTHSLVGVVETQQQKIETLILTNSILAIALCALALLMCGMLCAINNRLKETIDTETKTEDQE